jgi:YYY domain-containing protein
MQKDNQKKSTRFALSSIRRSDVFVGLILVAVMFIGASFRLMGNNWDDFIRFHPDERYLTGEIAITIGQDLAVCYDVNEPDCLVTQERYRMCLERYPATNGRGAYFDTECSPYNPENVKFTHYSYGTLPVFIVRIIADAVVDQTGDMLWTSYSGLVFIWRYVSAIADSLIILLVFLIGVKLHGKWVGLLASILYAFCVFPIQQAHFGTADAITNLFVTLGVYFLVRVQDSDSFWDYALFGFAAGAAVASRINVAPLAFVLAIPILIRMLPAFDGRLAWSERVRHFYNPLTGGVIAALVAMFVFRIFSPYAFEGPGFFGLMISERFLETVRQSQFNVSGHAEGPPNWQWVNRTSYLYSFQNMVLWGMGIALGLTGWIACLVTTWRIIKGRVDALRHAPLVVWIIGYFLFTGGLWVMSMRYYLPLYASLIVLASWLLVELVKQAQKRHIIYKGLSVALLVGVTGFTVLWGVMFTNIYRNMATFTQAGYYTWERIPADFYMVVDEDDPSIPLINVPLRHGVGLDKRYSVAENVIRSATRITPLVPIQQRFHVSVGATIDEVHAYRLLAETQSPFFENNLEPNPIGSQPLTVRVSILDSNANLLGIGEIEGDFSAETHIAGESYTIPLDQSITLESATDYYFRVEVEGGTLLTSGALMGSELLWDEPLPTKVCYPLPDGMTLADNPPSGVYSFNDCLALQSPAPWEGVTYVIDLEIANGDSEQSRAHLIDVLDQVDYIWVNTNRRYDTNSRIPLRWPVVNAYYDALFSGELGFEVEQIFQETFQIGDLKISDQNLPFYDTPAWFNEFEPEEAFTVYDHPVVMLFRKTDAYSPENTRYILGTIPLTPVQNVLDTFTNETIGGLLQLYSVQADKAPTHLLFTPEMKAMQQSGGTWSERFSYDSLINQHQVLAVVVWWLVIMIFGVAVFPLLFVLLPALSDRGYSFAKIIGITIVAWILFTLGTMRIPVWHQMGIWGCLIGLALVSGVVGWRQREKLVAYILSHWRMILTIEVISLSLYLLFVGVRLLNPDLWHSHYGGEKPMDFAYFNGVLRSTIFPAIDPWFADGYNNYYYLGFVIVSVPTLLTGIVPSIAYNLILPTLFSLVGIGAFGVAYNVVSSWQVKETPTQKRRKLGNPYVAGVMALLFAILLGNLDTVRLLINSTAQLGGFVEPHGMVEIYKRDLTREFVAQTGITPDALMALEIADEARANADSATIIDKVGYELGIFGGRIVGFMRGMGKMLFDGQRLTIPDSRWFWGPTRTIAEIPNPNGLDAGPYDYAINEMPYFTFLYGDLHPHMMSMPLMLFMMAFVFHEVMIAGRDRRGKWAFIGAIGLGALIVGLFQGVNTWEYPTFMILSVAGLGFAWWLTWRETPFTRASVLSLIGRLGGFVALTALLPLAYTWWFSTGITQFMFWEGHKTPLWAYIQIHGYFLFLIFGLLIWETWRWFRSITMHDLRGKLSQVTVILFMQVVVWIVALVLALMDYQIALIVLPMIGWIAVLFFRPNQSRAMQYILVLIGLGLSITMGTEFITLQFDNGRQNIIFKFYLQVWLLFSVVGGVTTAWLFRDTARWNPYIRLGFEVIFGVLLFFTALYPLTATMARSAFRFSHDVPLTLDGLDYMNYAYHWEEGIPAGQFHVLADDYALIRWLQDNIEGTPTIMEGWNTPYTWSSRISINTGLPAVVGWDYHQTQQRSLLYLSDLVRARRNNVNAFYLTPDIDVATRMLKHYGVQYIIVGSYELKRYDISPAIRETGVTSGIDKFAQMVDLGILTPVYQENGQTIYQVNVDGVKDYLLTKYTE